ncbi:VC0807 family protein [Streptosporangium sandarakinum]|uniref:VC0807 family protein n=1 Tax=Streptosporangium sandarakinum TaxID=1260955 RepID=UPI003710923F
MSLVHNPRLRATLPLLLDMASPAVGFFLLHFLFGLSPVVALTAGAVVAGARTLYRSVRERRLSAFPAMMLLILAATLLLVFVTGDPRLLLAKSAVIPALGGAYGILTTFFGRTVLNDVVTPFVTKGDERLTAGWEDCWENDAAFARRLRLINLLWGIGFLTSAVLRVVIVYNVPLAVAVVAGQVPTLGGLVILILVTRPLSAPLLTALHTRAAAVQAAGATVSGVAGDAVPAGSAGTAERDTRESQAAVPTVPTVSTVPAGPAAVAPAWPGA